MAIKTRYVFSTDQIPSFAKKIKRIGPKLTELEILRFGWEAPIFTSYYIGNAEFIDKTSSQARRPRVPPKVARVDFVDT